MNPKLKKCKNAECSKEFMPFKTTDQFCSYKCKKASGKAKPPNRFSDKRKKEIPIYSALSAEFLSKPENEFCFIDGCYNKADSIEHLKGRRGYADQWARDNNIPMLNDTRFWAPCCWDHNGELERNPTLSHKYQLSKIHNGKKGDLK